MKSFSLQKLNDLELWELIEQQIECGNYVFSEHSRERQKERMISDLQVLAVLQNQFGCKRYRNKRKDRYDDQWENWVYCIEGCTSDDKKMRIILTFTEEMMPIITVMWVK